MGKGVFQGWEVTEDGPGGRDFTSFMRAALDGLEGRGKEVYLNPLPCPYIYSTFMDSGLLTSDFHSY